MTNTDKSKLAVVGECMLELGVADQHSASIKQSCAYGNTLASTVIKHRGAIIPLQAMSHLI